MKNLHEKVSDLKELCGELRLDESTKEGKVLFAVIETLEDFAAEIARLELAIPFDLAAYSGKRAGHAGGVAFAEGKFYCPNCHEPIDIEESALHAEEHVICPKCNEPILISSSEI